MRTNALSKNYKKNNVILDFLFFHRNHHSYADEMRDTSIEYHTKNLNFVQ